MIDKRKLERMIVSLQADLGMEAEIDKDNISMVILLIALVLAALGIYLMMF